MRPLMHVQNDPVIATLLPIFEWLFSPAFFLNLLLQDPFHVDLFYSCQEHIYRNLYSRHVFFLMLGDPHRMNAFCF